jgi:hypothetical protein
MTHISYYLQFVLAHNTHAAEAIVLVSSGNSPQLSD